jgi:hypothetical protein
MGCGEEDHSPLSEPLRSCSPQAPAAGASFSEDVAAALDSIPNHVYSAVLWRRGEKTSYSGFLPQLEQAVLIEARSAKGLTYQLPSWRRLKMRRKSILVLAAAILCFALYHSREYLILTLNLLLGSLAIAFSGWLLRRLSIL